MACEHMVVYNSQPNFLSPYLVKTTWVCLYDGCFKIKKQMSRQQLVAYGEKMQSPHRVMIHCQTLEIFCTICNKEIYDDFEQLAPSNNRSDGSNSKNKKIKKINPYNLRQYLVASNQSETVFAGNSQYPPSFQKEKKGLCGLKANAINSYLNSVVHLLAYVPSMADLSKRANFQKLDSKVVRYTLEAIETIWSGKYRIYSIHELQSTIMTEHCNFLSYSHKTPQNVLYLILKCMLEDFYFQQLCCNFGSTMTEPYDEWSPSKTKTYSVMKQIFGGQCILEKLCSNCGNLKTTTNRFQCLKVNYQSVHYHGTSFKDFLLGLIEEALNWKNSHQGYAQKIQGGTLLCEKCQKKITEFSSYVHLPNNLVLQFGEDLNGLNICPPDEIDLYKFTIQAIKQKNQGEAIYDYIGCISRDNKRYVAHVKNLFNKKQFAFSDQSILEKERPHANLKIAIYKRRQHAKYQHLVRNIRSCLQVSVNPIVPLPDFWSIYLKEHHEVPALANPFICNHGKLKPNLAMSKMRKGPERIPVQVYRYLLEIFGGREISIEHQEDNCKECQLRIDSIKQIKVSQKEMAAFADKLSNKKDRLYIRREWLQKWKHFVYDDQKKGYKILGHARPGPIDNRQQPEADLQQSHKKISPEVWYFLHKFYGGGPRISQKDYKPNVVVKTSVNLRFQSLKEQFKYLDLLPREENAECYQAHREKIEQLAEEHEESEINDE